MPKKIQFEWELPDTLVGYPLKAGHLVVSTT
jgi:hypothetical protein